MSPDQVTQFAERLASNSGHVDSVLRYPHPFTNDGVVVVFDDSADSYPQLHAAVMQAVPPAGEKHIVKRSDLFLLSVPFINPLAPFAYPHMVFYLKNRGQVLFGEDIREQIFDPTGIESMLITVLDATACWFRAHNILLKLQIQAFASLMDDIDTRFRFLMSIALLNRTGQWEVQADRIPADFLAAFADEDLRKAWIEFDEINKCVSGQKVDWASTLKAVWLFEVFTRGLRRYA